MGGSRRSCKVEGDEDLYIVLYLCLYSLLLLTLHGVKEEKDPVTGSYLFTHINHR